MGPVQPSLVLCLACTKAGLPSADNSDHDCLNHDESCLPLGERPLLQTRQGARQCYTMPMVMPDDITNNSISCNTAGKLVCCGGPTILHSNLIPLIAEVSCPR